MTRDHNSLDDFVTGQCQVVGAGVNQAGGVLDTVCSVRQRSIQCWLGGPCECGLRLGFH